MKCLSIKQPYASLILNGIKTIELRAWQTNYRGKILICSCKQPIIKNELCGYALCIIDLINVIKTEKTHLKNACVNDIYFNENLYSWIIGNVTKIKPFKITGQQKLFELPKYLKDAVNLFQAV
jgi:hypothetical protein